MTEKALIVHHLRTGVVDPVTASIAEAGYLLDHRYPIEGDPLPDVGEGHAIALVHGSLADVTRHDAPGIAEEMRWIEAWWASERPYLGICHGLQLAAQLLGARVGPPDHGQAEFGYYPLISHAPDLVPHDLHVFQWHYYGADLPADAECLASSADYPNQVVRFAPSRFGLQCHAEMAVGTQDWLRETDDGWRHRQGAQGAAEQCRLAANYADRMHQWVRKLTEHWVRAARHG